MINLLKKHKYKLLTLMLSIVSIFTLFIGINKTYAYSTDNFSYTLTCYSDNQYSNEINLTTNYGIDNTFQLDNSNRLYFNINDIDNYQSLSKYYFLINYYVVLNNAIVNENLNLTFNISNSLYSYNIYFDSYTRPNNENNMISCVSTFNLTSNYLFTENRMLLTFTTGYNNRHILIKNIDIVKSEDIALKQYYDTYYGEIENNYNTLLNNYNTLQDNYDTLEINYGDLHDDYEELETNYNTLQENYSNLEDKTSYGIFGYLQDANFQYDIQNTPQVSINNEANFDLTDLQQLGIISSGGNYNAYYFETNYNPNYYGVIGNFYFNSSLPLTLIDLTFKDMDGALVEIIDDEGGSARFNITSSLQTINYNNILELSSSFSNFVDEIHIKPNNADLLGSMFTSSSYNVGYLYGTQIGFKNGRDSLQSIVDSLNNQVSELEQQNEYQYNSGYQNGLNVGASQNLESNGMKTLFNSILSYPVNMIKSVFDFEFMGINISSLIMFIISIGIVAFVIKKFL